MGFELGFTAWTFSWKWKSLWIQVMSGSIVANIVSRRIFRVFNLEAHRSFAWNYARMRTWKIRKTNMRANNLTCSSVRRLLARFWILSPQQISPSPILVSPFQNACNTVMTSSLNMTSKTSTWRYPRLNHNIIANNRTVWTILLLMVLLPQITYLMISL